MVTQSREQRLETLRASINNLQSQQAQLEAEIAEIEKTLKNDSSETVKRHIRLLHDYNEIKDIAQGLMGLIAEARGVRHVDVQREYGVKEQD
ncbi:DNA repair protein SWI5 [Penicillium subrubescens]|uniref:Mating-type switching protein swi5 n=1 Tax=Penicillium subrubescens TaxID=1316194 RepID=A0A1Q5SNV8_9EURO|nr:DNA repair protein SWI5 [Penicillium subrubescens]KAJ5910951.1 DNA repair protein SWI5 [Penicillium subrubescens]OKO89650.1 Mating-type switching protein swi5 [Penicillium subrubescens]